MEMTHMYLSLLELLDQTTISKSKDLDGNLKSKMDATVKHSFTYYLMGNTCQLLIENNGI